MVSVASYGGKATCGDDHVPEAQRFSSIATTVWNTTPSHVCIESIQPYGAVRLAAFNTSAEDCQVWCDSDSGLVVL